MLGNQEMQSTGGSEEQDASCQGKSTRAGQEETQRSPDGKDQWASTKWRRKIWAFLVEEEAHANTKKHSSVCLVWGVVGNFVWTEDSIQVTDVEDKATKKAWGLAEDPRVMRLEIHSLYNREPWTISSMGMIQLYTSWHCFSNYFIMSIIILQCL